MRTSGYLAVNVPSILCAVGYLNRPVVCLHSDALCHYRLKHCK
jgi:hypothetical protein